MRVAVVIVNYNSGDYLARCLDALEVQTRTPDLAVVVDNASSDLSFSAAVDRPGWLWRLPLATNTGFAGANNIAVSFLPDCDYVALLNPDTIPATDWLEQLVEGTARHEPIDFFGSCMLGYLPHDLADGTADVYHVSGLYWRRDHGRRQEEIARQEEEVFAPCAAAAMYPRKSFDDVGGFDERYFCYSEDIDLAFRLRARGCRAWYIPTAVVRHAGSATTGRRSDFSVYHGHRNLVWTFVKNMPGIYLWTYLPQHLLLNIVTLLLFSFRGQARIIGRAKWDALKGLPRAVSQRRVERHMRLVESRELLSLMRRNWLAPYRNRHD